MEVRGCVGGRGRVGGPVGVKVRLGGGNRVSRGGGRAAGLGAAAEFHVGTLFEEVRLYSRGKKTKARKNAGFYSDA
jgi:hypothetical protein